MELLERHDAAFVRLMPVQSQVVGAFRHRKDATGIGLEQDLRGDLDQRFAIGHDNSG
jgi:hypothetical protein